MPSRTICFLVQRPVREDRCGRFCGSWPHRTMQKHALSCGFLIGHILNPTALFLLTCHSVIPSFLERSQRGGRGFPVSCVVT